MTDTAPSSPSRRPPLWVLIAIVLLVVAGIGSPLGVNWFMNRTEQMIPVDTTGNLRSDAIDSTGSPAIHDSIR